MSIDIFSVWALKNIGTAVKIWQKELNAGVSMAEDPDEIPNIKRELPLKFVGYVTQQHKERSTSGSKRIVEAYDAINRELPEKVKRYLQGLYDDKKTNPHLGDIKHLSSLAPKSQTLHTPMIKVIAKGSFTSQRKQAREIFQGISERFIQNISNSI